MRRLVVSEFLTLDGVMQAPGHPDEDRSGGFEHGGWQTYMDDVAMGYIGQAIGETEVYLFGRRTYEIMAAHWPNQPDDDIFAATLNGRQKYVASTTLREPLAWQNSTLIGSDVPAAVSALKREDGGNISVLGSGELVQTLAGHGLVDSYELMICPLVLGTGKRLFRDGVSRTGLQLVDAKPTPSGMVIASYRPA